MNYYTNMPNNPMMLLSFVNTKLRDEYENLEQLCYDLEVNQQELEDKLKMIEYQYDAKLNRFV